ncbi:serine carboxypeptidase-like 35 [Cucurbita maxima]|uniref:Carboxypeptidase n=1 Tax=Cucurbita maxima TaxID=3661 RepID=A0A6J1IX39_CUCMA|nr:serine carboxypeptidase-like 35 [Cucurbita maxima]
MPPFRISSLFILLLATAATAAEGREIGGLEELEAEEARRREADRVTDLPGQPPVNFRHYAGYVKLRPEREEEEKALFYWFFEAENQTDVARKPLALWLNGGPGCSSIAYGAAQELGPFLVHSNGQLKLNNFSWNKAANIIFLEAPVGVGFSYTNKSSDLYKLGDKVTAEDSYAFLIGWFKRFSSFKFHDFYLAGESYAGHYVPQLAELIHERNKNSSKDTFINLKGFMIGNAAINDETDSKGMVEYAWSHGIISDKLYHSIVNDCQFAPESNSESVNQTATGHCDDHLRAFLLAYSDIDIYSIYAPICLSPSSSSKSTFSSFVGVAPRIFSKHELWHKLPSGYDPCTEGYAKKFFNRDDVQRALHANVTALSYPYTPCSGVIRQWTDSTDSVLPIIHKLLNVGLRIWVYSGDTDGRVPITSTRYSINKMGLEIEEEWRAWYHKNQVAGWVETYRGGLTLASVRGAGHQVPVFAPQQSLSLFSHFLSTNTLPTTRS